MVSGPFIVFHPGAEHRLDLMFIQRSFLPAKINVILTITLSLRVQWK